VIETVPDRKDIGMCYDYVQNCKKKFK